MNRWFRFYEETLNDPKVLKLSDRTYRIWVGMLCLASQNNGVLPSFEDMTILLRIKPKELQPELEKLIAAKLLDHDDNGIAPHNWKGRQYKSDVTDPTNAERQQRFRDRHRVTENTVTVTPPRLQTQNTDSEKKDIRSVAKATRPSESPEFQEFKKKYPKRKGSNPWQPARKLFEATIKSGVDPGQIFSALSAGVGFDREKIGTEFIPQAVKWLRDRRWEDHQPTPPTGPPQAPAGMPSDEELRKKYGQSGDVYAEAGSRETNGIGADNSGELRPAGALIRPSLRSF